MNVLVVFKKQQGGQCEMRKWEESKTERVREPNYVGFCVT